MVTGMFRILVKFLSMVQLGTSLSTSKTLPVRRPGLTYAYALVTFLKTCRRECVFKVAELRMRHQNKF